MATLCLFQTNFRFPYSCKPSPTHFCRLRLHYQNWPPDTNTGLKRLHISASSINKQRRNRRVVKSNEELCDEIRQFFNQVGLPQDHIPSTKDFMQHGRNDLANIVRRRGYKLIRELLESSLKADVSVLDRNKRLDGVDAKKKIDTGQYENAKKVHENATSEITVEMFPQVSGDHAILRVEDEKMSIVPEENLYSTQIATEDANSDVLRNGPELDCCNQSYEILGTVDSSYCDQKTSEGPGYDQEVEDSWPSIVPLSGKSSNLSYTSTYLKPDTEDHGLESSKLTAGSSFEQQFSSKAEVPDATDNTGSKDVPLSPEIFPVKDPSPSLVMGSINNCSSEDISSMNYSATLSLEEKVAKFVQDGDLDALEEGHKLFEEEPVDTLSKASESKKSENQLSNDDLIGLNGCILSSRDDNAAAEGHSCNSDKDLDVEAIKKQEEHEISNLKLLLREKEVEFLGLKKLIEKEKLALSVLQTMAETEINKAQKLVSEKDAELNAAEDSLSGLTEVQIQFCGNGDIVEVTGSFNGWHHRIKMDLEPSLASITDPIGSRKSKLWSAVLWLYPGAYEIKFIVDGHWRIDPQRESITRGHICNNILRVGR